MHHGLGMGFGKVLEMGTDARGPVEHLGLGGTYMEILEHAKATTFNGCIHGDSGSGKTLLATSLPWSSDEKPTRWGKKAVYVALDTNSETLESVRMMDRPHLILVKPSGPKDAAGNTKLNWHKEMFAIANYPWRDKHPDVGTIIWDTGTTTAEVLLRQYANNAVFSGSGGDKHVSIGDANTSNFVAQPMMGDYGMVQGAMLQLIQQVCMQPLNVIFLFQSDWGQPEGGGDLIIGPGTAGGKAINKVMKEFSNVFRTECKSTTLPGKGGGTDTTTTYRVYTAKRGAVAAKLRMPIDRGNGFAEFVVNGTDPSAFWRKIDEVTLG